MPFCPVCKSAGKSEEKYTSHYVRASPHPDAKVVCPTLLSRECKFCGVKGHTPKYCPAQKEILTRTSAPSGMKVSFDVKENRDVHVNYTSIIPDNASTSKPVRILIDDTEVPITKKEMSLADERNALLLTPTAVEKTTPWAPVKSTKKEFELLTPKKLEFPTLAPTTSKPKPAGAWTKTLLNTVADKHGNISTWTSLKQQTTEEKNKERKMAIKSEIGSIQEERESLEKELKMLLKIKEDQKNFDFEKFANGATIDESKTPPNTSFDFDEFAENFINSSDEEDDSEDEREVSNVYHFDTGIVKQLDNMEWGVFAC